MAREGYKGRLKLQGLQSSRGKSGLCLTGNRALRRAAEQGSDKNRSLPRKRGCTGAEVREPSQSQARDLLLSPGSG